MVLINNLKIMTFNKPYTLLVFLLCFCLIGTSLAQPCLAESNLSNGYSYQLEVEDNHEPSELLSDHFYITLLKQTIEFITQPRIENLNLQSLPCCNRDPPSTNYLPKNSN